MEKIEACPLCKWTGGKHDPACPNSADGEKKEHLMALYDQGLQKGRDDQPYFHQRVNAYVGEPTTAFHLGHENGIYGE